eukprot:gb/GECG01002603.1/.p1 GENE.gb/GECG01002603.1/~~gb/GECG01002603.1/.p1  ORF type:complete len:611 (+),score=66.58 gb/GECG01002603.1/:1-1833(+)
MDLFPASSNDSHTQRQQRIIEQAEADAHAKLKQFDHEGQIDVDGSSPTVLKSNSINSGGQNEKPASDKVTRRREINRVNAKKSRIRKKLFVESLVSAIERLEGENENLQQQLASNRAHSDATSAPQPATGASTNSSPSTTDAANSDGDNQPVHGSMLLAVKQSPDGKKQEEFPKVKIQFASVDARILMQRVRSNTADLPELFWRCDFRLIDPPVDKSGIKYAQAILLKPDPTVCGAFIEADPSDQHEGAKSMTGGVEHQNPQMNLSADDRTQTYGCAASIGALHQVIRACARDHRLRMLVGWIRLPADDPVDCSQAAFYQCYSCTLVLQYVRDEGANASLMCSCTWERYPLPVPSPRRENNTDFSTTAKQGETMYPSMCTHDHLTRDSSSFCWSQGNTKPPELYLGPQRAPHELTPEALLNYQYSDKAATSFKVPSTQNPGRLIWQQEANESSSNSKTQATEDPTRRGASVSGNQSRGNSSPTYSSQPRNTRNSDKNPSGTEDSEADSQDSMRSCGVGKSKNGEESSSGEESVGSIMKAASGLCTLGSHADDGVNSTVGSKRGSYGVGGPDAKRQKPSYRGTASPRTFLLNNSLRSHSPTPKGRSVLNNA